MNRELVMAALAALALPSCGGGGGSSSGASTNTGPVASQSEFAVAATIATLVSGPKTSFTVQAFDSSGNSFVLTVAYAAGPVSSHPFISTTAVPTFFQTEILRINGTVSDSALAQVFYTSPLNVLGITDGTNPNGTTPHEYTAASVKTALPTTAKVGDSGIMYSGTTLRRFCVATTDCSIAANYRTTDLGQQSATWSLEPDSANTAWLCINTKTVTVLVLETDTTLEATCFRISPAGSVLWFKDDLTFNSDALGFVPTALHFR
jgi:hypothetical protein